MTFTFIKYFTTTLSNNQSYLLSNLDRLAIELLLDCLLIKVVIVDL